MKNLKSSIILLIIVLLAITASMAQALDYQGANQITVGWTAVEPNNAGEQIQYVIYQATETTKDNPTKLWQGPETEYTATMTTEGKFILGLETLRLVDIAGTFEMVSRTDIGWSDDETIAPVPFGVQFYEPPGVAGGFGVK